MRDIDFFSLLFGALLLGGLVAIRVTEFEVWVIILFSNSNQSLPG